MPNKKCIPSSKEFSFIASRVNKLVDKWFENGKIQAATGGNTKAFKDFYWDHTQKDFEYGALPTRRELKKLEKGLDKLSRGITKQSGTLGTWFKLPEAIMRKNPITKSYFKSIEIASNHYRGSLEEYQSNFTDIMRTLDGVMKENSVSARWGSSVKAAQKKLAQLESTYKKLYAEKKYNEAETFYEKNLKDLSKDSELAVFDSFYQLVTNPKVLFREISERGKPGKDQFNPAIIKAASEWNKMSEGLWKELTNGLDYYAQVIKDNASSYNGLDRIAARIDKLKDITFEKNYYPSQVLEIFPTLGKLTEDIYSGRAKGNLTALEKYVGDMIDRVESNISVPAATFERGKLPAQRISKNVPAVLDSYIKNVIRFNYTSKVSQDLTNALKKLSSMGKKGDEFTEAASYLSKYIGDTHNTVLGLNIKNSKLNFFARSMTSWQFMGKLGLNLRTVARNATQSLQNYTYFGMKGIQKANSFTKGSDNEARLNAEMKKHGVYFVNLEELNIQKSLLPQVKEVDGRFVEDSGGYADRFSNTLENMAKITGKPMQWVENHVNRALTFKIAYVENTNALLKNDSLVRRKVSQSVKQGDKETPNQHAQRIEKAILDEISVRSGRFAASAVKELHYLYDPWAKPKVLQTPTGSVLGQFTTYGINFFEYQRKIAAKGGSDMMAREWNSPHAWRMYRLGLLYAGVNGVLSPLLAVDFSNLVQHDTYDRLNQTYTYMSGDEEEKEKTFFGKGPLLGTFGGPFVSDVIDIGNLVGLMNLDENDGLSYLTGYRDFADRVDDDTTYEVLRLLNTQVARSWKYTAPRWLNGTGPFTLAQQELGLYKTPEIKEKRKMAIDFMNKNAPSHIAKWFETSKMKKDKKKAWNQYWSGSDGTKTPKYTEEEIASIYEALNALD